MSTLIQKYINQKSVHKKNEITFIKLQLIYSEQNGEVSQSWEIENVVDH